MNKSCSRCGSIYSTEDKRRKFCGVNCYRAKQLEVPNAGCFKPGLEPWNKNAKGLHLSPASEFRPGQAASNHLPVGTIKVRHRSRNAEFRSWVKVADPNQWQLRAVAVWEAENGPLPPGKIVHHVDRDTLNDAIGNLVALTRGEHLATHRAEFRPRRPAVEKFTQTTLTGTDQ
jgi:hypothetical protein